MTNNYCEYFLSYARNDSEFALKLAKDLREAGANLWLDQLDIMAGQHWDRSVEKALKGCECMILVLSKHSVESNNVMDELSYAIDNNKIVIPVLIKSCDIPLRLQRVQYIDFTEDYNKGKDKLLLTMNIRQTINSVRVFFILCSFSTDEIKKLLIEQNQKQNIFDIGIRIADWTSWEGRSSAEMSLESMQKTLQLEAQKTLQMKGEQRKNKKLEVLLKFCDEFQTNMTQFDIEHLDFSKTPFDGVNIAVTELPFPFNYYTWNTKNRKGVVVGVRSLEALFQSEPQRVNKIIIRVIQRMLIYSLGIKDLKVHKDTKGCLFDFTQELRDIEFSVKENPMPICGQCQKIIEKDKGGQFFNSIVEWIKSSFK